MVPFLWVWEIYEPWQVQQVQAHVRELVMKILHPHLHWLLYLLCFHLIRQEAVYLYFPENIVQINKIYMKFQISFKWKKKTITGIEVNMEAGIFLCRSLPKTFSAASVLSKSGNKFLYSLGSARLWPAFSETLANCSFHCG